MSIPAPRAPRIPKPAGTHFMVDPVRIRSAWLKVGYVVIWFLIARILLLPLVNSDIPPIAVSTISTALDVGAIILGARIFRARNEDPVPPRPWWQLTGRPKAGFVIAGFILGGWLLSSARAVAELQLVDWPAFVVGSVVNVTIAAFYIRSSVLLRRRASA